MHSEFMSLLERLEFQASACRKLGSPLYAALLTKVAADVRAGGPCAEVLAGYENPTAGAAIPLRLLAGVHSLVLTGRAPDLANHYPSAGGTAAKPDAAWPAFRAAVAAEPAWIRDYLSRPPQTNEVGRAVPLLAGLLAAVNAFPLPVRLLELGSSAGLNLRADRFRWSTDEIAWGPADSPVQITEAWRGAPPGWLIDAVGRHPEVTVVERRGCDLFPIDPLSASGALALRSYVWPDQPERAARLNGALKLAAQIPADVVTMRAEDFLTGIELHPGTLTVVWHSIMRQYLNDDQWSRVMAGLDRLATLATADAAFAYVSFDSAEPESPCLLTVRLGADAPTVLARARPHGIPAHKPAPTAVH